MRYINPGFNPELEELHASEEDYILGGVSKLPQEILCPERNWGPWLPVLEIQHNDIFDPFDCTNHSNDNVTETIHKRRYNEEINKSDRFSANISGTQPGKGNSQKNVAECSRQIGYVDEILYPFSKIMTAQEFFTYPPQTLLDIARKFIRDEVEYGYEKVPLKELYDALQFSPCVGAVDSRSAHTSEFRAYDHSIMIYGFNPATKKWLVFDSYFGRAVEYDQDYPFGFILRFHYKRKVEPTILIGESAEISVEEKIINFIKKLAAIMWPTNR